MRFAPAPENDFAEFIRVYYEESRARCDRVEALAAKWRFEDLIPGLSDVDSRLILHDSMTADDWCRMSSAMGALNLDLCRRYPQWVRTLEHPPGANLTWSELTAPRTYWPEVHHWTFYHAEPPHRVREAVQTYAARAWDSADELFYLNKFCAYYGRYDRGIDPAINLGVHAERYPLHSRILHYFSAPVHAAVCLLERRHFVGKREGLAAAERLFPGLRCWSLVREILEAEYRTPQWYAEPYLTELDDALETTLREMAARVGEVVTLVPRGADVAEWKRALPRVPTDPARIVFDFYKFARLMKGRIWFYLHAPDSFDSTWLIQNELGRIGGYFFRQPFRIYWQVKTGEAVEDPLTILDALRGDPLTDADIAAAREYARLTPGHWEPGTERAAASAVVAVFDDFFRALTKINTALMSGPPP
ncbi:MAG TPA: hypothetical protein VFB21_19530 [Chthonomonadaceae bacterium]|nr:hypothetical protein [Chthonomonadaceae bacterium]